MVLEMADINYGIWEIGCLLACSGVKVKIEQCCARLCLLASRKPRQRCRTGGTGDTGGGEKLGAWVRLL